MLETLVVDNPLIVKHLRSRLRQKDLVAPIAIVLLLSLFTWLGAERDTGSSAAIAGLIALQGFVLFLMGTAQVANSVAQARDSGIIDFHRISPLPPLSLALGFLLGAPMREWIMAGCVVPFELALLSRSNMAPKAFAILMASMVICALMYHLMGLVMGLVAPRPRVASSVAVLIVFLNFACMAWPVGYFTMGPAWVLALFWSSQMVHNMSFFARSPEWHFLMALVHQLVLSGFLLVGAVREIRQERAYFCSKLGGLAFFAVCCVLYAIDLRSFSAVGQTGAWIFLVGATIGAMVLTAVVSPDARDFVKGMRRAAREQRSFPPPWSDTASNWLPLAASVALVAAGSLFEMNNALENTDRSMSVPGDFNHALAVAISALVAFACTRQGFELRFGKRARSYFMLLVFCAWIVPLLVGWVVGQNSRPDEALSLILGFCPWVAMGFIAAKISTSLTLVIMHATIAGGALYWRWTVEQASARAALQRR